MDVAASALSQVEQSCRTTLRAGEAIGPGAGTNRAEDRDGPKVACRLGMRPAASSLFVSAIAGLCAACHPPPYARVLPMGESLPSRPSDCAIKYERVAPADAQAQWRQVGEVCVSASAVAIHQARSVDDVYQPGDMHDLLTEQACALGGETVTPIGMCSNGQLAAIAFGVYVPR